MALKKAFEKGPLIILIGADTPVSHKIKNDCKSIGYLVLRVVRNDNH
jgi:hypothetical protein